MISNIHSGWVNMRHALKSSSWGVALYLRGFASSQKIQLRFAGNDNPQQFRIHLLATNSKSYVLLAQTCIYSFLRFHSNATFLIYVDQELIQFAKSRFKSQIQNGIVEIILSDYEKVSWQSTKLNLILNMCGTNDIFMDADLRWNGAIPEIKGITSYVKEFELDSEVLPIEIRNLLTDSQGVSMVNTSFFTFGGICIGQQLHEEIRFLELEIGRLVDLKSEIASTARMSEQLALSFILGKYGYASNFLKLIDKRNDGDFVESCYFGATGLTF